MTPQEKSDVYLDLFIHPGWKLLIEEMREAYNLLLMNAHLVNDERGLYRRKGEIQKLGELLAFEELTKLQMEEDEREDI